MKLEWKALGAEICSVQEWSQYEIKTINSPGFTSVHWGSDADPNNKL